MNHDGTDGYEAEDFDAKAPLRTKKLDKQLARLKVAHWVTLRAVVQAADGAPLPEYADQYLGKLVRLGLVERIENPGFDPEYAPTPQGKAAIAAHWK